ncbi:MAG: class I SAM-dependent methyltransferase [Candidatus Dormibacteraeota bacterium]|nr:class I SAM-dependent methyltransferase [Candidatus Dormibacteraeota bacterium]
MILPKPLKRALRGAAHRFGYDVVPLNGANTAVTPPATVEPEPQDADSSPPADADAPAPIQGPAGPLVFPPDIDEATQATVEAVWPYTMTSVHRVMALCDAVRYISRNAIPGDVVECGVWRGGSMLAVARTLLELTDMSRDLWLYDTFQGMPEPASVDRRIYDRASAAEVLQNSDRDSNYWAVSTLDEVKATMRQCAYPEERLHFVAGMVEETIPTNDPTRIALLRLDTDWYESTRHELRHLVPRMSPGGVMIIDDYGDWAGARLAVDEYLREQDLHVFLHRIDHTGRLIIMPA